MPAGATHSLQLPDGHRAILFVRSGGVQVGDDAGNVVEPQGVAVLNDAGTHIEITATKARTSLLVPCVGARTDVRAHRRRAPRAPSREALRTRGARQRLPAVQGAPAGGRAGGRAASGTERKRLSDDTGEERARTRLGARHAAPRL